MAYGVKSGSSWRKMSAAAKPQASSWRRSCCADWASCANSRDGQRWERFSKRPISTPENSSMAMSCSTLVWGSKGKVKSAQANREDMVLPRFTNRRDRHNQDIHRADRTDLDWKDTFERSPLWRCIEWLNRFARRCREPAPTVWPQPAPRVRQPSLAAKALPG